MEFSKNSWLFPRNAYCCNYSRTSFPGPWCFWGAIWTMLMSMILYGSFYNLKILPNMTFWQCDSKNQPLGVCNIYFIKYFNKYTHLLIFSIYQITKDVSLKLWENSHYLNIFLSIPYTIRNDLFFIVKTIPVCDIFKK